MSKLVESTNHQNAQHQDKEAHPTSKKIIFTSTLFGPPPSAKSEHTSQAASTFQAQKNSNTTTLSASASMHPTNPPTFVQPHVLTNNSLDFSDEAHKQVLRVCEETWPENQFIGTIAFLAHIQEIARDGLANWPLNLKSAAIANWKPSDVLKVNQEFIKAQYPPGYGSPDGSAAHKTINNWANQLATNTSGKIIPSHPMPTLKHLHSLIRPPLVILATDPWTEDKPFETLAVHTYQRPRTNHRYCVWNSVDDALELLKSKKDKYGKLYKDA
ncbi:hypothetical protein DFH28DRAFT_1086381 [Melampsora americana]|nr:hypothetical protein DFH28DRAFT_1086381 [Melampsora americana]